MSTKVKLKILSKVNFELYEYSLAKHSTIRWPQKGTFLKYRICMEVTDGQMVKAGASMTWNVLSWSGGHELKPQSGWTLGA